MEITEAPGAVHFVDLAGVISDADIALQTNLDAEAADRSAADGVQQAQIDALQDNLVGVPGAFTSYTNRAAFEATAGTTTDVDFFEIPAGEERFAEFTFSSGVTFKNVTARNHHPPFAPFVYRAHVTHNPIRIDLPPGTHAVGANIRSFYGDPGLFTIALSTGQESTTTSSSGFLGVVSDQPVDWITIRFYSACVPDEIYGTATCPTFPAGFVAEVLVITRFTFGP